MKISELIDSLERIKKVDGDIDIVIYDAKSDEDKNVSVVRLRGRNFNSNSDPVVELKG